MAGAKASRFHRVFAGNRRAGPAVCAAFSRNRKYRKHPFQRRHLSPQTNLIADRAGRQQVNVTTSGQWKKDSQGQAHRASTNRASVVGTPVTCSPGKRLTRAAVDGGRRTFLRRGVEPVTTWGEKGREEKTTVFPGDQKTSTTVHSIRSSNEDQFPRAPMIPFHSFPGLSGVIPEAPLAKGKIRRPRDPGPVREWLGGFEGIPCESAHGTTPGLRLQALD